MGNNIGYILFEDGKQKDCQCPPAVNLLRTLPMKHMLPHMIHKHSFSIYYKSNEGAQWTRIPKQYLELREMFSWFVDNFQVVVIEYKFTK
jgi:hypothetical protein